MSSPASLLSSLNSDDFEGTEETGFGAGTDFSNDSETEGHDSVKPPPSKRRRLSTSARSGFHEESPPPPTTADFTDVSSDSSDSCPSSPKASKEITALTTDEVSYAADSVHTCLWNGCDTGDLPDQDALVSHMNELHVPQSKDDKYLCDWGDCRTRTRPHGSAYALKAHLRSHTKEKPFYCALPGKFSARDPRAYSLTLIQRLRMR